jgi:hypothetical protein
MERDWILFALKLAEGARLKVAEDRQRLETILRQRSAESDEPSVGRDAAE